MTCCVRHFHRNSQGELHCPVTFKDSGGEADRRLLYSLYELVPGQAGGGSFYSLKETQPRRRRAFLVPMRCKVEQMCGPRELLFLSLFLFLFPLPFFSFSLSLSVPVLAAPLLVLAHVLAPLLSVLAALLGAEPPPRGNTPQQPETAHTGRQRRPKESLPCRPQGSKCCAYQQKRAQLTRSPVPTAQTLQSCQDHSLIPDSYFFLTVTYPLQLPILSVPLQSPTPFIYLSQTGTYPVH